MPKVIVYSKLNCPNCEHVKWGLQAQDVPYEVRMIETKEDATLDEKEDAAIAMHEFKQYGYMAAPVTVFPNGNVMDGFHHGKFVDELRLMGYDL
ncbi:glutaredoxin-like protein [Bacillus phage Carmen17]|uniref:Glutaredoxin-like protein n=1 Tax=Bacillus phage Carmen17 TaxID=2072797 RepID=A0A2I7QIM7_9CAUD|nr:thioredoxin domain [Bacillus phage Carmen17]AUR81233.1 glutaredoxin-like protein [Bacillus phage Carmen17]